MAAQDDFARYSYVGADGARVESSAPASVLAEEARRAASLERDGDALSLDGGRVRAPAWVAAR